MHGPGMTNGTCWTPTVTIHAYCIARTVSLAGLECDAFPGILNQIRLDMYISRAEIHVLE
jgi:hypothetical protein